MRHDTKVRALLSIVVPVYGEAAVIGEFYERAKSVLNSLADSYDHEIIFVNDGSADDSLEILLKVAASDPAVRVLDLSRNFGQQSAITAGVDYASGDAIIVTDVDLQDPPELFPEMVSKWREGYKGVYCVRMSREGENPVKMWITARFYRLLQRISDVSIPLDTGEFRLIDRAVADALRGMREQGRYTRGLIAWLGFRQCGLPYERDKRYAGTTKYTLGKTMLVAMNAITGFSAKPLYLAGYVGILVTLVAFAMTAWLIISKLINPGATGRGWTSLIVAIMFFGGLQLMCLGLVGQYLARVFDDTKGRPIYVVNERYGFGTARPGAGESSERNGTPLPQDSGEPPDTRRRG